MEPDPLKRGFYVRDPVRVATELLGVRLVRCLDGRVAVGRIVEVEAYLAEGDPANHAYKGRRRRNESMFGPPGHAYVYSIHGHHCLNVVTEPPGRPSAVLIRAIEPLEGIELMQGRRGTGEHASLASGPGRLCQALAIDRSLDGWDLTLGQRLWLSPGTPPALEQIKRSPRVGVTAAQDLTLRFYLPTP